MPGTGIHLNNVMGEEDLNPFGFHRHPRGRRMPSMMAPSVVMRGGRAELVLGSAGSNRIRSALLQTIVGVVDHGMQAREAVDAPRVHFEDGVLYAEPGIDLRELASRGPADGAVRRAEPVLRRRAGGSARWRGARRRGRPATRRRRGERVSRALAALRCCEVLAAAALLGGCAGGIQALGHLHRPAHRQRSGRAADAARQRRGRRPVQRRADAQTERSRARAGAGDPGRTARRRTGVRAHLSAAAPGIGSELLPAR